MRKVLALLLPALLLLTACTGGSDSDPLSSVKVTSNGDNAVPNVEFDTPLSADEPTLVRVNDGDGEEVTDGQMASVRLVVLDPESGEAGQETYTAESAEDIAVDETLKQRNEQMYSALLGAPIGSDFAYYVPGDEASGTSPNFIVFTLTGARDVPTRAWGTDVDPVDGLPTVSLAEDGKPTITIPEGDAPTELVAQELKSGDGKVVEADDTVTVQYHGVKYSDGSVFDSSWERGSVATFGLNQVISAWTDGLSGKKVGSQVLIVAPPATAYGDSEGNELKDETLVFVVDILEAK